MTKIDTTHVAESCEICGAEDPTSECCRCHCGAQMAGSDHCPFCGCEEFETTCEEKVPSRDWKFGDD